MLLLKEKDIITLTEIAEHTLILQFQEYQLTYAF